MAVKLYFLVFILAALAVPEAIGLPQSSGSSSRHFFRGHQVPGMDEDPLEDELHQLRVAGHPLGEAWRGAAEEAQEAAQKSLYEAAVVPLEQQLQQMQAHEAQREISQTSSQESADDDDEIEQDEDDDEEEQEAAVDNRDGDDGAAKSGERLFKMMVDLAEHPAQWQKLHQELKHLDEQMVASRQAAAALVSNSTANKAEGVQLRHPNVRFSPKVPDALLLENEMDKLRERHATSSTTNAAPSGANVEAAPQHSSDEHRTAKHWAQFSYHRVTASPLADPGLMSSSHGRHSNAFVAVSDVTPPKVRAKVQKEFAPQGVVQGAVAGEETQRAMMRPPLHKFPVAVAPPSVVIGDSEPVAANTSIDNEELEIERLLLSLKAPPMEGAWGHNQNRKWVKEKLNILERLNAQLRKKWQISSHESVEESGGEEESPPPNEHPAASSLHHPQSPSQRH